MMEHVLSKVNMHLDICNYVSKNLSKIQLGDPPWSCANARHCLQDGPQTPELCYVRFPYLMVSGSGGRNGAYVLDRGWGGNDRPPDHR